MRNLSNVVSLVLVGQKDHDTKLTRSSVSSRYAAVIFLQLLQSKESVFMCRVSP